MSNALSIAAVTVTMSDLIVAGLRAQQVQQGYPPLNDFKFTTKVPDEARKDNTGDQVNLFLFHVDQNPHWRNRDLPGAGPSPPPLLPLNLLYLVTTFAASDDGIREQMLLGRVMSVLHDHRVLLPADIEAAVEAHDLGSSDLQRQAESVRLTFPKTSPDEVARLWTGAQKQYRNSVVFEMGPVLIESFRPRRSPLPVLRVEPGETEGLIVIPGMHDPRLLDLRPFRRKPLALIPLPPGPDGVGPIGDPHYQPGTLLVRAESLPAPPSEDEVRLVFRHPLLARPRRVTVPPDDRRNDLVRYTPPPAEFNPTAGTAVLWPAGIWTVTAEVVPTAPGRRQRSTNALPFALLPVIEVEPAIDVSETRAGVVVKLRPPAAEGQQPVLLVDRERPMTPRPSTSNNRFFADIDGFGGRAYARVRVDGADSLPFDPRADVAAFDPALLLVGFFKPDEARQLLTLVFDPPLPTTRDVAVSLVIDGTTVTPAPGSSTRGATGLVVQFGDADAADGAGVRRVRIKAKDVRPPGTYDVTVRIDGVDYGRSAPVRLTLPIARP